MKRYIVITILVVLPVLSAIVVWNTQKKEAIPGSLPVLMSSPTPTLSPTVTPTPTSALIQPPPSKILENNYHVYQSFNNCGPAAFSMALSYYGINESQQTLGQMLRPFQNQLGDNDDKSVTLEELAKKAPDYNLVSFHRANGTIDLIKLFIAYDIPVVTRTWLQENEDIGHYRVVKGYDDTTGEIIQDDSLQGANLRFSYSSFNAMWDKFGYEFLVFVPKEKLSIVEEILAEDFDEKTSWNRAVKAQEEILSQNPDNIYARFNLSVALYRVGEYQRSVEEFEKVEGKLSSRTLWYQIEPIHAYAKLGNFDRVMEITDYILSHENRAFSELYIIRGDMLKERGDVAGAKAEYEKAVFYNTSLKEAQERMESI